MYKVHQDATLLSVDATVGSYKYNDQEVPQVTVSASKDKDGKVNISLCNIDHKESASLSIQLRGIAEQISSLTGTILTADTIDAHNTFEQPEVVIPTEFTQASIENEQLDVTLPPMSVVLLTIG
jgi:alpha-N-arabinofuranosidase